MESHLKHPQIHVDYYKWLGTLSDFDKQFIRKHSESFNDANALMMWAWSRSRETIVENSKKSS